MGYYAADSGNFSTMFRDILSIPSLRVKTDRFDGSHPDVSRNYWNRVVSVKHNLIYSLITIRLATGFDPVGLSSGLHYEPTNVGKLRTFLESQQCLQK